MTRRKSHQRGNLQWHNNCWTVRYWELNQRSGAWTLRRARLDGFKDPKKKKAARKAADDFITEVNRRNNNPEPPEQQKADSNISFQEFIETHWKPYVAKGGHQPTTVDARNSLIRKHLMPFFGEKKMRDIVELDITDCLEKSRKTLAPNSVRTLYGLVYLMFQIAELYKLIDRSPVKPMLHSPAVERPKKVTLTAAQIRSILSALTEEQDRLFCLLLAVTGMRVGEALALRWADFDPARSVATINHTLYLGKLKRPKTDASGTTLRLHPAIAALLLAHKERSGFQSDADFVFCEPDGAPLRYDPLRRRLYRAMDRAEIVRRRGKHGFHIFRHSAGTLLYSKSRDLKLVQGTLRHADISTTSGIYVHLTDEVLKDGTDILTEEILTNCDLFVTQKSEMVS